MYATNNLFLVSFISSTHTSLFCLSNLLLVIIGMCEFIWEISLKSPKLFICFICNPVLSTLLCFICEAYLVHLLNLGWIRTHPHILFILTILLYFFTSLLPFFITWQSMSHKPHIIPFYGLQKIRT